MDAAFVWNWVLGVVATLLGGLNIFQLLTFKAYRRERNAQADTAEIESLSKIIAQNQAEIGRLSERLTIADQRAMEQENKYNLLYEKYDKLRDEFESYKSIHK